MPHYAASSVQSVDSATSRHCFSSRSTWACLASTRATVSLPSCRRVGGCLRRDEDHEGLRQLARIAGLGVVGHFRMRAGLADRVRIVGDLLRRAHHRLIVEEVGAEEAGLDHRDADAERRDFGGQRLADAFDRELGRTVDAPARIADITADRREVDDMAGALAAHVRQHGAGDVQQAEHVGAVDAQRLFGARLLDAAEQTVAGVVDQHVDPAERLHSDAGRFMRLRLIGDVELHGQQPLVLAELLFDRRRVAGGCNHRVALGQGFRRDPCAEAAGRSCDEPDTHRSLLCFASPRPLPRADGRRNTWLR